MKPWNMIKSFSLNFDLIRPSDIRAILLKQNNTQRIFSKFEICPYFVFGDKSGGEGAFWLPDQNGVKDKSVLDYVIKIEINIWISDNCQISPKNTCRDLRGGK